jgi:hypothetical protein
MKEVKYKWGERRNNKKEKERRNGVTEGEKNTRKKEIYDST